MEFGKLGRSGLEVSAICLGCMTYGDPALGDHPWTVPQDDALPVIRAAIEAGINFFDTANVYSLGSSEEILGRALSAYAERESVVIATKVFGRMRRGPNGGGLSRKAIFREVDASLKRLGADYIDLLQIHRLDRDVLMEETLEALNDIVRSGRARYVGASSMYAWEFATALAIQRQHGWA